MGQTIPSPSSYSNEQKAISDCKKTFSKCTPEERRRLILYKELTHDRYPYLLYNACDKGWENYALLLLENCDDSRLVHCKISNGSTPLHIAIYNKMEQVALKIISTNPYATANVNSAGETPLMIACFKQLPNVAIALLKTGHANTNYNDYRALYLARCYDMPQSVISILECYKTHGLSQLTVKQIEDILLENEDVSINK